MRSVVGDSRCARQRADGRRRHRRALHCRRRTIKTEIISDLLIGPAACLVDGFREELALLDGPMLQRVFRPAGCFVHEPILTHNSDAAAAGAPAGVVESAICRLFPCS